MDEFDSPIARTAPISLTFDSQSVALIQTAQTRLLLNEKIARLLASSGHSVIPGEDPQSENDHKYVM